ncbi:hypothetical protein O1611_g2555 [Lasiodiplodia mahajangana]|uniref:Uncharacterized protein n=1 Tax=Lasiodiplodia mahajangana TaxID=1108764 RepID=A0ACC2JUJ9_9PEZI|nr:hypothetical protein O1611_g2555 [Lasiodiplodia mahajangana]
MPNSLSAQEATTHVEPPALIDLHTFEVALGALIGFALFCFVARIAIRLIYQKRLRLDDAFLLVAAASLIAATGVLYHISSYFYLSSAVPLNSQVTPYTTTNFSLLLDFQTKVRIYLALTWTTPYAIKGCFLAFMRPLVWHISRGVNWYYWFIVGFCIISWAFAMAEPNIICPYFGADAVKCIVSLGTNIVAFQLTVIVNVLDILSDIMVVSIPIIVLRNSLLSRSTKFGVATFLCLSIFMAIIAIIRLSGYYYKGYGNSVWEFFWQQVECAVAVTTASITAFRTLFVKQQRHDRFGATDSQEPSLFRRFLMRFNALAREQPDEKPTLTSDSWISKLPQVPSPILTGIRTFIHRNGRSRNEVSVATFGTLDSEYDVDYHVAIIAQVRLTSSATH